MEWLLNLYHSIPSVEAIIQWGGLFILVVIIFSETGLLLGFFLPGDSLLFTAGLFAASGHLDYWWLCISLNTAAILGNTTGYAIGSRAGQALYKREDSFFFKKKHLIATKHFYEKYGAMTIILAQFMPFARTFAPVVAGIAEMKYAHFIRYNIIGAIAWIWGICSAGYFLGRSFPKIAENLHIAVAIIIFFSILPGLIKYIQVKRSNKNTEEVSAS